VRSVAIVALLCRVAGAQDDTKSTRVVLADPDPELRRAVETSLRPWKIEVVVEPAPPPDTTAADERATADAARFVVWRDGSDLVVFDHDSGSAERRAASAGAFDPVGAAAAALTVKTMMRLPPPPDEQRPIAPIVERGLELRFQAGFATRFARGGDTEIGGRFTAVGLARPFPDLGIGFGAAIDLGTESSIDSGGFKGGWRDYSALAVVSWTLSIQAIDVDPWVGGGLAISTMNGLQNQVPRDETATLATVAGGVWVRRRFGMWSVGGSLGVQSLLDTPTYTKPDQARAIVFEVPSFGVFGGVVLAADLAP
jgi:hypothetical protein